MICKHDLPISAKCRRCFDEGMAREAEEVTKGRKPKSLKQRKCKSCREYFIPRSSWHKTCSPDCAEAHTKAERLRKERRELTEYRQKNMTLGHRHELTQRDVNAYVVARDRAKGLGCVSCGTHDGKPQAGHYLSRGARPGLRYDERNLWLQCYRCNVELSSNAIMYRIELVKRIGAQAVEELEQDYTVKNYTHTELIAIGARYRKLLRELTK